MKVDRFDGNDPDQVTALKLNHVRKFQTGIYDYSVMTSVFVDPARDFAPLKSTFSSQEWCGHVFEDARFGGRTTVDVQSYFEGETKAWTLPAGAHPEDALLIWVRSLASKDIDRSKRPLTLLGSSLQRRLKHQPAVAFSADLVWSESARTVDTPAGAILSHAVTHGRQDGSRCTIDVEVAYPHRIVGWACTDGESAKLLGTQRLPYWSTQKEGDGRLLGGLGLAPLRVAP